MSTSLNALDTSSRKVIVYNINKFMKAKQLEKEVQGWISGTEIKVEKMKKPPKNTWVVITLENESMVEGLLKIVNDNEHKNKKGGLLRAARPSEATGDARDGKRSRDGKDGENSNKRSRGDQAPCVKTVDEVRDKLTPLWRMSYEEQKETKTKLVVNKCFSKITSEIRKKFHVLQKESRRSNGNKDGVPEIYEWLKVKKTINLAPLMGAPRLEKYRNKSELTFGYRHSYAEESSEKETEVKEIIKTPAVGFKAGGWAGGVSRPHCLSNIPDIVCGIADVLDEFLKTSPVPPYLEKEHQGIWRTVTIRSSERTNECMIIIVHAPSTGGAGKRDDGSDDYSSVFEDEKKRLIKLLSDKIPMPVRNLADAAKEDIKDDEKNQFCDIPVTSIFFQEFAGLSNPSPQHPVQHAFGKECIEEKLLQCTFQISPGAFFQVTTEGAENLYNVVVEKVKEVTTNPKETLLFDVCCGTGTIGLTCIKENAVGKVVGIDISEPAIKDAIVNAEKNGYSGTDDIARFVASRAEHVMSKEVRKVDERDCSMVAVVDPARDGLHPDVIKALRAQAGIKRIVYVSCNPTGSLVKDAALLCSPQTKKYKGLPFKISAAQPVDMFPLTDHCEMVMVFDRMTPEEAGIKVSEEATKEGRKPEDSPAADASLKDNEEVEIKSED
mmetsp:Transcript_11052/g.16729  ORF Transcript_11052/g.16729 Transcript_11052/m.16729 type:complete len:665 (+) Transcript_11052:68-2062(+)